MNKVKELNKSLIVKLYQYQDSQDAHRFLRKTREDGNECAVFIYYPNSCEINNFSGWLLFGMPPGKGITKKGYDDIKDKYGIHHFYQGEEISLNIKDSEIENACNIISNAMALLKPNYSF